MIKANVKFFGSPSAGHGLPEPYYSYLVISSSWELSDSGVASVIGLSTNCPMPSSPHRLVLKGGPEQAYKEMLELLSSLTGMGELKRHVDRD